MMFVENNAVLKHKFQRLHMTVVNSVNAARIIDFLFQEKVLGEDDMYRSVILFVHELLTVRAKITRAQFWLDVGRRLARLPAPSSVQPCTACCLCDRPSMQATLVATHLHKQIIIYRFEIESEIIYFSQL